jgi:hypothetical protein
VRSWTIQDHSAAVDRLRSVAREWAGDDVCEIEAGGTAFLWMYGSTMIEARADRDGSVLLRAFLVLGPRATGAIEQQLRAVSETLSMGRLEIDEDGDIALVHRVPARAHRGSLLAAMSEVSRDADRLDDLLCARLGGIRSVDQFQHDVLLALGQDPAPAF